jgi:type III pantothenate kinase
VDLLIDIGNTSLKWATQGPGGGAAMQSLRHHGGLPIDLHASWEALPAPKRVLVSNVAGAALGAELTRACLAHWGLAPRFAQTRAQCFGVRIAYAEPERLGVDRWLALLAAYRDYAPPVLIVDAGTAVTYDALVGDGQHLGGLILPGMRLMREAVLARTQIPPVEPEESPELWGRDTASAVANAALLAPTALAERLGERLRDQTGAEPELILTGGDGEQLLAALERPARLVPDLVLRGLALLA